MSTTFDKCLQNIVMQMKVTPKEHKDFLYDSAYIAGWINTALKQRRSMLAGSFSNLPATATYISGSKIDVPANFNCYLLLDLRFPFYTEIKNDDCIYLHSVFKEQVVGDSLISAVYLQTHLRNDLSNLLRPQPKITCKGGSGRSYQLCYHTSLYPVSSHTIIATQLKAKCSTSIVFDFLVAIKLPIEKFPKPASVAMPDSMIDSELSYWIALPVPHFDVNYNGHSYMGRSHVWQKATPGQRQRWCLVVRMFYMMSSSNGTLNTIGIHSLKHTCVNLCEKFGIEKADRPIGLKLMDMMITHGARKLREVSIASRTGQIVNLETHPALATDCSKMDALLSKMKAKMTSKEACDMESLSEMFGLSKKK
ncbi:uncharacterized protein LOC6583167 [Drosophila mojavensis]|uniref:Mab-21-like HhH/H2TH-like domain-containing protein n=1 Tax=Drosophila mojavensis TaxID=7230 RepID=B4KUR5_DROMO|nr:uncharacterized protein LOC6583167 [Drosophila mojavensis]EDW19321.1 uncharacterized protein Dmoj_GI11586 [Drosophila mojavensis]